MDMEQTNDIFNDICETRHIPESSPYYDRLRALSIELDFAPFGSPEHQFLNEQIRELKHRARKRMMLTGILEKKRSETWVNKIIS
jgi:hypothetical protein